MAEETKHPAAHAPRRRVPPEPAPLAEPEEPPFYEATDYLKFGGEGASPVNAYGPGDHVAPADVLAYGWGNQVKVPEQFASVLAAPGDDQAGDAPAGEE